MGQALVAILSSPARDHVRECLESSSAVNKNERCVVTDGALPGLNRQIVSLERVAAIGSCVEMQLRVASEALQMSQSFNHISQEGGKRVWRVLSVYNAAT